MKFDFSFQVSIQQIDTGKWEVQMEDVPVRAFGSTRKDAYGQFLAVYELYREYGEDWMAAILSEQSERFTDSNAEMLGTAWTPADPTVDK